MSVDHGDYIKETKRILRNYNKMKVAVVNLAEEIEALETELRSESVAIARYGDEPQGGTSELNATEAAANRRIKTGERLTMLRQRKADIERMIRAVDRALACLAEADEILVRRRYIDGYDWWQVARAAGYTGKWARTKGVKLLSDVAMMVFGVYDKPVQLKLWMSEDKCLTVNR